MIQYWKYLGDVPVVFTEHDISNISFFRSYFREMTGWRRWGRLVEWMRLVKYQIEVCRDFDGIVTLTPKDEEKLRSFLPHARQKCITTGVDLSSFPLRRKRDVSASRREVHLVYVGHYLHYPNEDAILDFARRIFPRVLKLCPIARLWVVGSGVTDAVRALEKDPQITVTGTVADVRPYLARADVYVAPLRLGEGIKGKILEAFAVGVPVVTTPVGARGLAVRDGEHLFVTKTADEFARKTVRLAFDQDMKDRMIKSARRLVEERYDWRKLALQIDSFYREILGDSKSRRPSASLGS